MAAPDDADPVLRLASLGAAVLARYHRAELHGAHLLPAGPALLVGNHGTFGLETPVFFWLLHRATRRYPIGLADRALFGGKLRSLLARLGGVPGTREGAQSLLAAGNLVVCYPGGVREVFKAPEHRYRLRWEQSDGFARVAIRARVPVVPFAGLGVDHSFIHLGRLPFGERLGRYAPPLALGPLPARLAFRLGEPMQPPASEEDASEFKARVQARVERLLDLRSEEHVAPSQAASSVIP